MKAAENSHSDSEKYMYDLLSRLLPCLFAAVVAAFGGRVRSLIQDLMDTEHMLYH